MEVRRLRMEQLWCKNECKGRPETRKESFRGEGRADMVHVPVNMEESTVRQAGQGKRELEYRLPQEGLHRTSVIMDL